MDVLPATQHAWVPGARPTARSSLPFLTLMSLGVLSIALPPYHATALHLALIAVLAVGLLAVHRHAIARDTRTWLELVAPLGTFSLVVVLRDAAGGSESGLAPLVLVPLLWLAIFGTRKDLLVAVVLVAVTFLAPVVVLGEEKYQLDDWRKAVIWTAAAALLALAVQDVVRRFAAESRRSRDVAARLEGVFRGATLTSLITTDVEGKITSFRGGAESQLGYAADDVLGRDLTAILFDQEDLVKVAHELGVEPGFAVLSRLAHQQAPSRIWPMVRADGDRVFVRMAVTELRDDEDQLVGYLCVSMDATVATVSEQALTQAEERWRVLMEQPAGHHRDPGRGAGRSHGGHGRRAARPQAPRRGRSTAGRDRRPGRAGDAVEDPRCGVRGHGELGGQCVRRRCGARVHRQPAPFDGQPASGARDGA